MFERKDARPAGLRKCPAPSPIVSYTTRASPFAWPAGFSPITYVPQGELTSPEPDVIENPFVTARATNKQTAAPAGEIKPVKLANPFVANR